MDAFSIAEYQRFVRVEARAAASGVLMRFIGTYSALRLVITSQRCIAAPDYGLARLRGICRRAEPEIVPRYAR